jgi:uncharacterized Ntn-hydrolase superfamily protein
MTFSIVAGIGDAFGMAVAGRVIAVGSVVPAARTRVDSLVLQALREAVG